jgi:hypothetical protein
MKKTNLRKNECATAMNETRQTNYGAMSNAATCELPCCTIRMEECRGGCKIYCTTDDEAACTMLQELCNTLEGSACCIRCMRDGEMCCECRFDCCDCTCQPLMNGVCLYCSTGDKAHMEMVQAMCKCLCCCCETGCECVVCLGTTSICNCCC